MTAGLLAYANSLTGEFVWDDASSILLHEHVRDPSKLPQLFREDLHAFGRGQGNFYRPLLAVSFMVDCALSRPESGQDPGPVLFHLTNVLWHVAGALFLFALLTRMGAPRSVRAAVPVLFVVHPLHTEAVTYISGRGDPMASTLMLAALCLALWQGSRAMRAAAAAGSALCFIAALLSKESATIFPFLLAPLVLVAPEEKDERQDRRLNPRGLRRVIAPAAILGVYAVLRLTVLRFGSDSAGRGLTLWQRTVETAQSFALYVRLIFVPTGLHMERTLDDVPGWIALAGAMLLLMCAGLVVYGLIARRYRVAAGMAWFLITWFPVSGLIPLNAPMAEHWLYLPLAGFLWAIVELLSPWLARPRLRYAGMAVLVLVSATFMLLTARRNVAWHTNESIFRATLDENPRSIRVHYNLAVTYETFTKNIPGARRHYERVIELYRERKAAAPSPNGTEQFWDDELESHLSLGNIALEERDLDSAAQHFAVLLSLAPNQRNRAMMGEAALGLASCLLAVGEHDRAQSLLDRAGQLLDLDANALQTELMNRQRTLRGPSPFGE